MVPSFLDNVSGGCGCSCQIGLPRCKCFKWKGFCVGFIWLTSSMGVTCLLLFSKRYSLGLDLKRWIQGFLAVFCFCSFAADPNLTPVGRRGSSLCHDVCVSIGHSLALQLAHILLPTSRACIQYSVSRWNWLGLISSSLGMCYRLRVFLINIKFSNLNTLLGCWSQNMGSVSWLLF